MVNWTDPIIHWNQLGSTELKRLIATWGMTPEQIAKYDKKQGFEGSAPKAPAAKAAPAKAEKPAKAPAKKVVAKPATRQKHTGANGEVKFVEHRNLYVGFWDNRVVVTKRTREACLAVLQKDYNFGG